MKQDQTKPGFSPGKQKIYEKTSHHRGSIFFCSRELSPEDSEEKSHTKNTSTH